MRFLPKATALACLLGAAAFSTPASPTHPNASMGPAQDREIRALLPPPSWFMNRGKEFGVDPDRGRELRARMQNTQRGIVALKQEMKSLKQELRESLSAEPFDRASIESRFAALMEVESRMKLETLAMRLDLMESITPEQRAEVRRAASRENELRQRLRTQIEQIRREGKRLHATGADTTSMQAQVREIEGLIRRGLVDEALTLSTRLLDELD